MRDWCRNSHTEERLWGIQREKYKRTLKGKPFAFDKSLGNLRVIHGSSQFFPCGQWTSIVPWQFAAMKARKDRISITVYFLWSPIIVRTRKFSVSELTKKFKRLIDTGICSLHFKETDIAITFLSVKIFLQAAIRLSLTPKLIDRGYPETLIMSTRSVIKFEDRKLALQQRGKEHVISGYFLVTQYHSTVPDLKRILMQKWHLIQQQPLLSEIFIKDAPIVS